MKYNVSRTTVSAPAQTDSQKTKPNEIIKIFSMKYQYCK
jgi:hypothetical protein